jgi:tetratricopeptide (TPR) repeat protein
VRTLTEIAEAHFEQKDFKKALTAYDEALKADSSNFWSAEIFRGFADVYTALGDTKKAEEYAQRAKKVEESADPR